MRKIASLYAVVMYDFCDMPCVDHFLTFTFCPCHLEKYIKSELTNLVTVCQQLTQTSLPKVIWEEGRFAALSQCTP